MIIYLYNVVWINIIKIHYAYNKITLLYCQWYINLLPNDLTRVQTSRKWHNFKIHSVLYIYINYLYWIFMYIYICCVTFFLSFSWHFYWLKLVIYTKLYVLLQQMETRWLLLNFIDTMYLKAEFLINIWRKMVNVSIL